MTGTDTTQPFIYHPWLKKTSICLLKAPNILLYYFVSTKSLLSTTLLHRIMTRDSNLYQKRVAFSDKTYMKHFLFHNIFVHYLMSFKGGVNPDFL